MTNIALFISGTGGNALNILKACREGRVSAMPVVVISSSTTALGNARLAAEGVSVHVLLRKDYPDDVAFSEAAYSVVEAAGAELICLCGWLKKLHVPPRWTGRILNIHPALLPAFGGAGMYGMNVHRAVLAAGAQESGCTVHLVDDDYDRGRILAQARVPVQASDTPEDLQHRVYEQEMRLYPEVLATYLERIA